MDGVLNINKHSGPTSHDIVNEIRRIVGQKRVGHAGTLDPMASGVLVVCLGRATRIVEYLMGGEKEYRAKIALGAATDTQDSTGTVIDRQDASHIKREMLEEAAAAFVGDIDQIPPMVSAVKHQGQRLYKLARQGQTVERQPRQVTIYSIRIEDFEAESMSATLLVRCSSGTYIRTLCADIGERLGYGAHMSGLVRTRVGRFVIDEAVSIDGLRVAEAGDRVGDYLVPIDRALDMPAVSVTKEDAERLIHGLSVECETGMDPGQTVQVLAESGELLAIGNVTDQGAIRPHKVLVSSAVMSAGQP